MARNVNPGKTTHILNFIRQFSADHGFGPTIREVKDAVGLKSTSTVFNYLTRMERDGLVSSIPGTPRSLRVLEPRLEEETGADGGAVLNCKFKFPEGTFPVSVIAMVSDGKAESITPVTAEQVEVLRMGASKCAR